MLTQSTIDRNDKDSCTLLTCGFTFTHFQVLHIGRPQLLTTIRDRPEYILVVLPCCLDINFPRLGP
jgi:hypothetical protein